MTSKNDISKVLDLHPGDLLVCENCRCELPIPPDASNRIVCYKCHTVMDKSHFSPLIRKQRLWVSERGLNLQLERYAKPPHFSCVDYYRRVVRVRQAIFDLYNKQGSVSLQQAVGIFVSFFINQDEGVSKFLAKDYNDKTTRALRKGGWLEECSDGDKRANTFLFDLVSSMPIKQGVGRPMRSDTLLLLLDAAVLMFCPNAYMHLLRDALRLRAHEYKECGQHAQAHREAWQKFWKAKRAVEASCQRVWQLAYEKSPEPPPPNWWERVAYQERLMEWVSPPLTLDS